MKLKQIAQERFKTWQYKYTDIVVEETIIETIGNWNWDFYRRKYERHEYTYVQLAEINDLWWQILGRILLIDIS